MTSILTFFERLFPILLQYKYLVLFLSSCLEGFNTFLVAGFFIANGTLSPVPTFFIALVGEVINSFLWYSLGYWGGARWIDFLVKGNRRKKAIVKRIRQNLEEYTGAILLLVKMTWSITTATIIMIGSIKYSIRKFALYNVIGSFGWVLLTLSLGYFLGTGYQLYVNELQHISYLILLVVITLIAIIAIGRGSLGVFTWMLGLVDAVKAAGQKVYESLEKNFPDDPGPPSGR